MSGSKTGTGPKKRKIAKKPAPAPRKKK